MRKFRKKMKRRFEQPSAAQSEKSSMGRSRRYKMIITPNHKKFREMFMREKRGGERRAISETKKRSMMDSRTRDSIKTRDFSSIGRSILTSPSPRRIRHSLKMSKRFKTKVGSKDLTSYKNIKKIGLELLTSLSKSGAKEPRLPFSDDSIKDLIDNLLKSNKFIKKKFRKYLNFLLKLTETETASLQVFLSHISENSISKHSGLSAKSVRANWPVLQQEFNNICKEIQRVLFEMKIKEIQVVNLKKNFDYQMKIRKFVKNMLRRQLQREKPPVDFIGTKMEVRDVLNRLDERGKKWNIFRRNYDSLSVKEDYMTHKYKRDWGGVDQMQIRDYKRKKNRIKMYRRDDKFENIFALGDFDKLNT